MSQFLAMALYPKLRCWTIYFNLPFLKLMDGTCCYLRQLKQAFTIRVWLFLLKLIFNAKSEDVNSSFHPETFKVLW